jgi:hypothetical protein
VDYTETILDGFNTRYTIDQWRDSNFKEYAAEFLSKFLEEELLK